MADVKIEQTRVALNTSTGTQNITISGFGTPKAAIFIVTQADTDDTIAADSALSIGFTDGTTSNAVGMHNDDGSASVDSDRWMSATGRVLTVPDTTTIYAEATFSSWITDGIQINITAAPAAGLLLTVILIGGTDVLSVKSFLRDLQSTTAPSDYTGIGFETDICFLAHNYSSIGGDGLVYSPLSFGCFINDVAATPTQKSICWEGQDGSASGAQAAYADDNAALCATLVGAYRWSLTISDIDSTGFTHTNSGSTSTDMIGLAIEVAAGVSFDLFDVSIPTTGNYTKSGLSFEPTFGMLGLIQGPTAYNTIKTSAPAAAFSIATFDANGIFTNTGTDEDGAATTVCKSLSSDQFRVLDYQGSADAALASGYTLNSDGWTFTLTTNPTAAILGWGFAFSAGAAGGTITGSGGAPAGTSSTDGSGTIGRSGTGAATAQDSTTSGTGTRIITGIVQVVSTDSSTSGSGTVTAGITGVGAATSGDSTTAGTGSRVITGVVTVVSGDSTTSGTGEIVGVISGSGGATAGQSTTAGAGKRVIVAIATVQSGDSTVSGTAVRTITGTGTAVSGDSTTKGYSEVPVSTHVFHLDLITDLLRALIQKVIR